MKTRTLVVILILALVYMGCYCIYDALYPPIICTESDRNTLTFVARGPTTIEHVEITHDLYEIFEQDPAEPNVIHITRDGIGKIRVYYTAWGKSSYYEFDINLSYNGLFLEVDQFGAANSFHRSYSF